jgi:RNA polymerase sigma factor (sigma-70 family)
MSGEMQAAGPHEMLARDRRRYERLLLARMGASLSREDAEDIVSEALIKAQLKMAEDPPRRGHEGPWFSRMVLNLGIDFLRARDGRRSDGVSQRPNVVPLTEIDEDAQDLADNGDEPSKLEELAEQAERAQAEALVERVMATLDPKEAELVKLRHLLGRKATRQEVAAMAGLSVGEFRWRYAHFVEAVAMDAPTERCGRTRQLLGELDAGTAPAEVSSEIDAHTMDCASCRVFARESYRALEVMPFVPVVGFADRWSTRIACWWDRSGPETTAGAGTAATGAGIWALLGRWRQRRAPEGHRDRVQRNRGHRRRLRRRHRGDRYASEARPRTRRAV